MFPCVDSKALETRSNTGVLVAPLLWMKDQGIYGVSGLGSGSMAWNVVSSEQTHLDCP